MDLNQIISKDKVVSLNYVLSLNGGEEIDRTASDDPLIYLHGHQNIIPGLEKELEGKQIGDSVDAVIPPNQAYGEYDEEGFHTIDRSLFPENFELEVGMLLHLKDDNEEEMEAFVHEISDDEVVLDVNHPLAGETLHFKVEIVNIRSATAGEIDHGHAHIEAADHS